MPLIAASLLTGMDVAEARGALDFYGVNLAGAEFSYPVKVPGTAGTDYFFPNLAEVTYYQSKGMNTIRLPFLGERLQPTLGGSFEAHDFGFLNDFVGGATAQGADVILDVHNFGQYIVNGVQRPGSAPPRCRTRPSPTSGPSSGRPLPRTPKCTSG